MRSNNLVLRFSGKAITLGMDTELEQPISVIISGDNNFEKLKDLTNYSTLMVHAHGQIGNPDTLFRLDDQQPVAIDELVNLLNIHLDRAKLYDKDKPHRKLKIVLKVCFAASADNGSLCTSLAANLQKKLSEKSIPCIIDATPSLSKSYLPLSSSNITTFQVRYFKAIERLSNREKDLFNRLKEEQDENKKALYEKEINEINQCMEGWISPFDTGSNLPGTRFRFIATNASKKLDIVEYTWLKNICRARKDFLSAIEIIKAILLSAKKPSSINDQTLDETTLNYYLIELNLEDLEKQLQEKDKFISKMLSEPSVIIELINSSLEILKQQDFSAGSTLINYGKNSGWYKPQLFKKICSYIGKTSIQVNFDAAVQTMQDASKLLQSSLLDQTDPNYKVYWREPKK